MTKRKDGRYQQSITINGKVKVVYGNTKREVTEKIENIYKKNTFSSKETYQSMAEKYLENICLDDNYTEYKTKVFRIEFFYNYIGNCIISEINADQIQKAINALYINNPITGNPTCKRTIERYLCSCSKVFEYGIKNRVINFNPCEYVDIPKKAEVKDRESITDDEMKIILGSTDIRLLPAKIMILTGLRRGELGALQFRDIDFDRKIIKVTKSLDCKTDTIKEPKTKSGMRIITIPEVLIQILKEHKEHYCPVARYKEDRNALMHNLKINERIANESDYVITGLACGRMTSNAWKKLQNGINEDYGTDFTWHMLRHTYASLLYESGVDLLSSRELLGHSDVKTTMSIYTHLSKMKKINSIDQFNEFINNISNNLQ